VLSPKASSLKKLSIVIPVVLLPLALWLGYRALSEHSLADIQASIIGIPNLNLALALGFVAASYLCLTGFDALAVRYAGRSLPYRKVALTSFVSLSIGHNVGGAAFSSGALRYRFYSGFGLSALDVGKIIVFCGLTVTLGLASLAGIALLLGPELGFGVVDLRPAMARFVGVLCLAAVGLYLLLAWWLKQPLVVRGHEFRMPSVRLAAGQILVGTANFACVAAALHQLMAGAASYAQTVTAYVLGNIAGILSHVPGGLGVLEFIIGSLLGHAEAIGALIVFRVLYFLLPLLLGGTLLATTEVWRWRTR
jgi:glycosyltransferase 2 family protein